MLHINPIMHVAYKSCHAGFIQILSRMLHINSITHVAYKPYHAGCM